MRHGASQLERLRRIALAAVRLVAVGGGAVCLVSLVILVVDGLGQAGRDDRERSGAIFLSRAGYHLARAAWETPFVWLIAAGTVWSAQRWLANRLVPARVAHAGAGGGAAWCELGLRTALRALAVVGGGIAVIALLHRIGFAVRMGLHRPRPSGRFIESFFAWYLAAYPRGSALSGLGIALWGTIGVAAWIGQALVPGLLSPLGVGRCSRCGYELGEGVARCPECGDGDVGSGEG